MAVDILSVGTAIVSVGTGVASAAPPPPTEFAPTDIVFSTNSVPYDAAEDDVLCTLSAPGATQPVTYTIVGGDDAALVYVDGAQIKRSGSGSMTADDVLDIEVRSDNGVGSPYDETWTPTVYDPAAEVPLTTLTLTNASGGAKTGEPFAIPIPLAPGALPADKHIRVYDDDGVGGQGPALGNFQWTDEASDMDGETRLGVLAGIVPALGGSATRKLWVMASDSAPPTGTAITASDLLATSFQMRQVFDFAGATFTFDARAALAAGEAFSKTGYQCVVRSSGPTCTRIFISGPPRDGSDNPHASGEGLRCEAEIIAYKAGTAAVSGGNPITTIIVDPWVMNGELRRAAPQQYAYGYRIERATSLGDGTLIHSDDTTVDGDKVRYDYMARRTVPGAVIDAPNATATNTGNSSSIRTWTISGGVWPSDVVGSTISDGTGLACITNRVSDTTAQVVIYRVFAGTTIAADTWVLENISHPYNMPLPPRRVIIGAKPSSVVIWGDLTSAVAANSRAPMEYLSAARLAPNIGVSYASITHNMAALNGMRGPDGDIRPSVAKGVVNADLGDVETYIGAAGASLSIGLIPEYAINGFIRFDANGRRKIMENAEYWSRWPAPHPILGSGALSTGELGVPARVDGGEEFTWDGWGASTDILRPTGAGYWPYDRDLAHHGSALYPAYLLTGDIYWLRRMAAQAEYGWALDPRYNGSGNNKTSFGAAAGTGVDFTPTGNHQPRAKAWTCRDMVQTALIVPDSISPKLVSAKSYWLGRCQKTWQAFVRWCNDDEAGIRNGPNNTPGFQRMNDAARYDTAWQNSFIGCMFGHARELGMLDSNGHASQAYHMGFLADMYSEEGLVSDYVIVAYKINHRGSGLEFPDYADSVSEMYRRTVMVSAIEADYAHWARSTANSNLSGTLTISDETVGAGRTFTFSQSMFLGGDWYIGAWISAGTGRAQITAINSQYEAVATITVAFASTTPTLSTVKGPGFHPLDYDGSMHKQLGNDYPQVYAAAAAMGIDAGVRVSDLTAARASAQSFTGYTETKTNTFIVPRA